jgi:phosphate transport system protein
MTDISADRSRVQEQRRDFHEQLDAIETMLVRMAAMVIEGIQRVTEAVLSGDVEAAQAIIDADDDLDLLSIDVEEAIYRSMALQQPVASDLRLLVSAIKLNAELERSGDLVTNIAKGSLRLLGAALDPQVRGLLDRMREQAALLFEKASASYVERDGATASALHGLDDQLDELHRDFIEAVFWSHSTGRIDIQQSVQLCLLGRFYERLGDHAVNCGERITYLVTGELPEHAGAERARQRRLGDEGGER